MSCLGVHFALEQAEVDSLLLLDTDADRLGYLEQVIEERYFAGPRELVAESDKSWDAMHRALSDGTLAPDGGRYPLDHVVLGGRSLYAGDDYIMSLKTPAQVEDIAAALSLVNHDEFRARYDRIQQADYAGQLGDEDFAYTWEWFASVRALYAMAAVVGRAVLFTTDQ